jgi:hypothetical protein
MNKHLNSSQQRQGRITQDGSFTSIRQVIQKRSVLLTQGHRGGQNTFDKQTATYALRTITTATPDHTPTESPFGVNIGRLNTLPIHKSPQSLLNFEDIQAGTTDFMVVKKMPISSSLTTSAWMGCIKVWKSVRESVPSRT